MKKDNKIEMKILDRLMNEDSKIDPELQEWINSDGQNKQDFDKYQKIWFGASVFANRDKFDTDAGWNKIHRRVTNRFVITDRFKIIVLSGVAASLFVLLGFSYYFNWISDENSFLKFSTGLGSRSEIILPDGTNVKLNCGSELTYNFNKAKKIREIRFSGEGYFEVVKNKVPLEVIVLGGMKVKVLGTKFNLKAYPDDNLVKTTLVEGRVELYDPNNEHLVLSPGQTGVYHKLSSELNYANDQTSHNISWMNNKIYMDNMSLGEVCTLLERWYNVKISFTNDLLGEKFHYTGVLQEESVVEVFKALSELSEIEFQITGKNIIIKEKKNQPMKK